MKTIIFDMDGTLCDIMHRIHHIKNKPQNWDAFHSSCVDDTPKDAIVFLWKSLAMYRGLLQNSNQNFRLIVVSGRSDVVREETRQWLMRHLIDPDEIVMRTHGDHTPDDELKRRWLNEGRFGPKEDILFCVDDRQRVVDMWREEGLTCLQVEAWAEDNHDKR